MLYPDISFTIVSHGHYQMIRALIDDLALQGRNARIEIILALNIPEDINPADTNGDIPITVIRNPTPKGFGANMNAAARIAKSRFFCVLNPDIRIPEPKCLELLCNALTERGHAMIAPAIKESDGRPADAVRGNLTPLSVLRRRLINPNAGRKELKKDGTAEGFFWLPGMFMLFDLEKFRQIGGFDERLFLYCEDYDICARMHLAGMEYSVLDSVSAIHEAQRRSRKLDRHLLMHLTSLVKVWTSSTFWRIVAKSLFGR